MNIEIPWSDPKIIYHTRLMLETYRKWTGKDLLEEYLDDASNSFLLYHAPFAVISHGVEEDPVFNYANLKAQEVWKMTWEDFTVMPLRLTIEETGTIQRQKYLEEVQQKGFIENESCIRVSGNSGRFRVQDLTLWNLEDGQGMFHGQAAMFTRSEKV